MLYDWTIDTTAPRSTIAAPSPSVLVSLPGIWQDLVHGTSSDGMAGVAAAVVSFALAVGVTTMVEATLECVDEFRRACLWTAPPPVLPGVYTMSVSATDLGGNAESPGPAPITVVVLLRRTADSKTVSLSPLISGPTGSVRGPGAGDEIARTYEDFALRIVRL